LNTASPYNEIDLFKLVSEGNEQAFRRLFDLYRAKLYLFVLHIVENEAETEEIVQDIFLRIWVSRQVLAEVTNQNGYMFTVARNRSLDHIRHVARERKMKGNWAARYNLPVNATEEDLDLNESRRLIDAAINELSPQQATIFKLSKLEGLKRQEIAVMLGISENTVRNHLFEAIKFIKNYMKEHGDVALLLFAWLLL
jgi:RNA polymerase sigma-70 factor (family 1)